MTTIKRAGFTPSVNVKDFGTSSLLPARHSYRENLWRHEKGGRLCFECYSRTSISFKPGQLSEAIKGLVKRIMGGPANVIVQNLCMLYFSMIKMVEFGHGEPFINPFILESELQTYVERINRYGTEIYTGINQHLERARSLPGVNAFSSMMVVVQHFIDSEIGMTLDLFEGQIPSRWEGEGKDYYDFCVNLTPLCLLISNLSFDRWRWERIPEDQRKIILNTIDYLIGHAYLKKEKVMAFLSRVNPGEPAKS